MKKILFLILIVSANVFAQQRTIAITIDDLPVVSPHTDISNRQAITRRILAHLNKAKAPVTAFVNETKLYDSSGKPDDLQIDLLRMWLDQGIDLGNHTYSHISLNAVTLSEYEDNILKGEIITKRLMTERGKTISYFRHPYLFTGRTMEIKSELGKFLTEHGYTIAPISFDDGDYIFAAAYEKALDAKDKALVKRIGKAYVPYMRSKLEYWERQSERLFKREIAQTLLIHANIINSYYLGDLIAMFKKRGYRLISLDEALKDDFYKLPDKYLGRGGISWLHRVALERGKEFLEPHEPSIPDFVLKASGFDSE